jgi:hypothetical protein
MTIPRIIALLACVAGSPAAMAVASDAPVPPEMLAAAPARDRYPDSDGLWLRRASTFRLADDGRLTREEQWALRTWGPHLEVTGVLDPRFTWNDARSEIVIDQAGTWRADASWLGARPACLVPTTPHALDRASPYAAIHEMVLSHVGVEPGATLVSEWTLRDRAPSGVPFWGVVDLDGDVPVLDQTVTLVLPETAHIAWVGPAGMQAPVVTREKGTTSYVFLWNSVPPVNLAELSGSRTGRPRLVWSSASDWASVRAFLESRALPAIRSDDSIRRKTAALIEGSVSEEEKLARIHAFVTEGIRTADWPIRDFDWRARPAFEVLVSSVGHALDKAVLECAMLREAGMAADVAFVSSREDVALGAPTPQQLDEVWVRVVSEGVETWVDPTAAMDARSAFSRARHLHLVLDGKGTAPVAFPALDARSNRASLSADLHLVETPGGHGSLGVSGTLDVDLAGLYDPIVAFDRSSERQKALAAPLVAEWGKASLDAVFIARESANETAFRAGFSGGTLDVPTGGVVAIHLPRANSGLSSKSLQGWRRIRTLPLEIPGPASERSEVAITVPAGFEVVALPEPVNLSNGVGSVLRTVRREKDRWVISCELEVHAAWVDPSTWADLRTLLAEVEGESGRTVLLWKKAPAR